MMQVVVRNKNKIFFKNKTQNNQKWLSNEA